MATANGITHARPNLYTFLNVRSNCPLCEIQQLISISATTEAEARSLLANLPLVSVSCKPQEAHHAA
ncbi:hypothetical protein [Leminorella grimontii]|uniref:hypothetical protein n=1 Tax=Leminorella grimontii TaxID=82981 RepID=UPI00208C45C3|nr:hypothetical protein [Leminorella grimontii]GKX58964.1 hypothetical protein SOASR031_12790 [Leminorella grimontii]